jgi:predicted dehydrogenase
VTGETGQVTADFMTDSLTLRHCRQQGVPGGWWSTVSEAPQTTTFATMSPHEYVALELADFIDAVATRRQPDADVQSGVAMAAVCDAIFAAARERRSVRVEA